VRRRTLAAVATREELEKLSSKELHDRAMHLAERRLDVKFIWDLLSEIPAAEAATGNLERAEEDVNPTSWAVYAPVMLVHDLFRTDEGKLAEALRPVYIDYLLKRER
jgi:hypothetical protein